MIRPCDGGVYDAAMARHRTARLAASLVLVLATAACTPALQGPTGGATRPPADATALTPLERTAWEAWLLMEIGRLRTGAYSTQVLVDLALPQGIRWTVVEFGPDGYALAVSSDAGGDAIRVSPDGVASGG